MYDDYNNKENEVDKSYEESRLIEEQKSYEEDDRNYRDESNIKTDKKRKKTFRGSFLSYLIVILVASIIGGLMAPYIGANLYGSILPDPFINQYNAKEDTNEYASNTNQINISPRDDITTVTAVAKKEIGRASCRERV